MKTLTDKTCFGLTRQQFIDILIYAQYCGMCTAPVSMERFYGLTSYDQKFPKMLGDMAFALSKDVELDVENTESFSKVYRDITRDLDVNGLRYYCEETEHVENITN